MLLELFIRNFAIIDELRLQIKPGFNVLTGETGAGKSIILDAVMLVLGGRADTNMVRAGTETAYVEATFSLSPELQTAVLPLLEAEGLEEEAGEEVLLARELRMNGRNICRINGRAVSLSLLREVAAPLIDIHGQGEHLSLLKPRSHLPLLDSFARLEKEREAVAKEVSSLQQVQKEMAALRQNERQRVQRINMLSFQIQEISAANLQIGETDDLRDERTRLSNTEHLTRHAAEALALLSGVDDETPAAIDLLGQTERALIQLARVDPAQEPQLEQLQGLAFQVSELAAHLQRYLDSLEFNPERLDFVEERLELIHTLKRKYQAADEAELLTMREQAEKELDTITHSEERIAALEQEEEKRLRQIGQLAAALSEQRQAAAQTLAVAVEAELAHLSMSGARFQVDFQTEPAANGAFVGHERLAYDQSGIDKVEFLLSTNPGEPLKPMAKVASGGETARLMLGLKTALAQVDATPTLIFDEIDQGIGGRVGDVVGQKLWGLTAVGQHQVIVVTHLPQLAGYGDAHFHVSKQVKDGRTITAVEDLDRNGRITELAAMLGTQGVHARGGAESILAQANHAKHRQTS
ncbi:MAG: DNA repair protein RecN [Chloroflexi bacterium]|nr:DNA repair protein RecN [Chloroflexota bacterium]MBK7177062.1 DNA repair protein RecN [Chloroflexota bacterium]MBK8931547.1 DNA repair protein RecN [Chloroflexota bacterium]